MTTVSKHRLVFTVRSWEKDGGFSTSPVGNDDGVVELAAAVLTQGRAPSVGDDGVGAV